MFLTSLSLGNHNLHRLPAKRLPHLAAYFQQSCHDLPQTPAAYLVARLRGAAGSGMLGRMMECFYCLSLWIAAPLAAPLATGWLHFFLLWPALSGAAILLEQARAALGRDEH